MFEGARDVRQSRLTAATALSICRRIKDDKKLDVRANSGTSLKNKATGKKIYTPPEG